jgi:class 3 adenylate cyclase
MSAEVEQETQALPTARAEARAAAGTGDLFASYDRAVRGLETAPTDLELRYLSVLALARSGATELARRRFTACGLDTEADLPPPFDIDVPALAARLAKDAALQAGQQNRPASLRQAAEIYRAVYDRSMLTRPDGAYYPAINAAALCLWAGAPEQASTLARAALQSLPLQPSTAPVYWRIVTEAEAELILGNEARARSLLITAGEMLRNGKPADWQDVASTRRQLRRTCRYRGINEDILAPLSAPRVIAYTGHMIGVRFRPEFEAAVADKISEHLDRQSVIAGYGSLAGGSDVLFAEALLERKAELHLVFPFVLDDFVRESVDRCGPSWRARFERCLAAATTVRYATQDHYLNDDATFHYASRLAMGRALLRARLMDTTASLIAVWDGNPPAEAALAGASTDIGFWNGLGHSVDVIAPDGPSGGPPVLPVWSPKPNLPGARVNAAILFGDLIGFSRLKDSDLQTYVTGVLGTVADVLARHQGHVLASNTWGDAFFAIVDDVLEAAACAVAIQSALAALDTEALGLPGPFLMRIGGHYGPVQRVEDPVLGGVSYMGVEVVRAARIEPVAEPGMIWVTEAFAAALELRSSAPFACDYLGMVNLAKGFGRQPLYWLHVQ